jgi:hypothetical protein
VEELAGLRLLIPVAKLYTAKQAVAVASEAVESFGGAGYIEDTGLPRLLRDAQVLSIWEGTTNVLSLDVLRALEKTDALGAFINDAQDRLATLVSARLAAASTRVKGALAVIERFAERLVREDREFAESWARAFSYAIARTTAATLLLQYADWSIANASNDADAAMAAAIRWCERDLAALENREGPVPSPMLLG